MNLNLPLSDTGYKISQAYRSLCNAKVADEKALDSFLNDVSVAFIEGTYDANLVQVVRDNVKSTINFDEMGQMQVCHLEKSRMIWNTLFKEMIKTRIFETQATKSQLDPAAFEQFGGVENFKKIATHMIARVTENFDVLYDNTQYAFGK